MLKRTLSILTLIMVFATVLAACGSAPATTAPTVAAPAATSAPAAQPAATAAPAVQATAAAPSAGGDAKTLLTVSAEQQATWVRTFNPFLADRRYPAREGMYEPLMVYNTVKGELVPWLATESKFSSDNKKLTFTVRDGVKWSDGQPFTAKDVAFASNLLDRKSVV